MQDKINKTTRIVRDAMKAVAKDVRAPKAVREGKVKTSPRVVPTAPIREIREIREIRPIEYIQLGDKIFKAKHILNYPVFSQEYERMSFDFNYGFKDIVHSVPTRLIMNEVKILLQLKPKKAKKLFDYAFKKSDPNAYPYQKKLDFVLKYKDGTRVISTGMIVSLNCMSFDINHPGIDVSELTFMPDVFTII